MMIYIQHKVQHLFRHTAVREVEPTVDGLRREAREHPAQIFFVVGCCDPDRNRTHIPLNDLRIDLRPLTGGMSCPLVTWILHRVLFPFLSFLYFDSGSSWEKAHRLKVLFSCRTFAHL